MVSDSVMKTLYTPYKEDGSVDTDSFLHIKHIDNQNKQQISSDQSLDLLSRQDKTMYNIGYLNQNKETAEQELSKIKSQETYDAMSPALKKVSSDPSAWKAIIDHFNDAEKVDKVWDNQVKYKRESFLANVWHDALYQNKLAEANKFYAEANKAEREGRDPSSYLEQGNALTEEASNMMHAQGQTVASSAGSFASSMWQTKETIAAQTIAGVAAGPIAGAVVGAAGGFIQSKEMEYNSMIAELRDVEGLTAEEKHIIADKYSTWSGAVEMLGWNLGVGKMVKGFGKGLRGLVSKSGKEGLAETIKNMSTKEGFLSVVKSFAGDILIEGAAEGGEEVVQTDIATEMKSKSPQELKDMDLKQNVELAKKVYTRTINTGKDIAKSFIYGTKMSDYSKEQLSTFLYTFAGTAILGGPSSVVSNIDSSYKHNKAAEDFNKTGLPQVFEGQENLRKTKEFKEVLNTALNKKNPEAFDEIFKRIADANDADGTITITADALGEAINSVEDEALKEKLVGISTKVNEAIDNKVELTYSEAKILFTDEAEGLFNQIMGDISWDRNTMSPNEAVVDFANNYANKTNNVDSEKVAKLEQKFVDAMPKATKKEKELAHANAMLAWHHANALHQANPERSVEDYLDEITNGLAFGDENKGGQLEQRIKLDGETIEAFNDVYTSDGTKINYAEYESEHNTGVNREAMLDREGTKIIPLSPQQFLHLTPKQMGKTNVTSLEDVIKKGGEIAMPFLEVEIVDEENKVMAVVGHEGRHRSLAMKNLGVNNGYVILYSRDFYKNKEAFKDGLKGWSLMSQDRKITLDPSQWLTIEDDVRDTMRKEKDINIDKLISDTVTGGKLNQTEAIKQEKQTSTVAGAFDPATLEIRLTSASNPTTFAHELMHYFMFNMVSLYNAGMLTGEWRTKFEKAMDWAGATKDENGHYSFDADDPSVKAAQEKLAEGFTSYLLKGEAPTKATRGLFGVFKTWFKAAYAKLRMGKVRLNKNVTDFYDYIFAVDGDIEMEAKDEKLGLMDRPEGVSDEDWGKYQEAKEGAKDFANAEALKIMEKRSKVKSIEEYEKVYEQFIQEKLEELKNDVRYQARNYALNFKIGAESVRELFGEDKLDSKFIYSEADTAEARGESIQAVAKRFGFDNDIEGFVEWLNTSEDEQTVAEEYAEEMAEKWIDENYPELRKPSAEHALRNINAMKVNIYEYMILNKIPFSKFTMLFNEITKAVESVCAEMSSKDLVNFDKWERRLKAVLDKTVSLQNVNSKKGLASLKYRAAMLNYMIDIAKAAHVRRVKFARHFNKYKKFVSNANLKTIDGQAWNIILDVLNAYGMTGRHTANPNIAEKLNGFIDSMLEAGYTDASELKEFVDVLSNAYGTDLNKTPFGNFIKLDEVLRTIEAYGKNAKILREEQSKLEIEEASASVCEHAKKINLRARKRTDTGWKKLANNWMNFVSMMETQLSAIIPEDINLKYIQPFFLGLNKAEQWKNEISARMLDIIKPILKYQNRLVKVAGHQLSVMECLAVMLNAGNEHNLACMERTLKEQKGFDDFDINQMIQEIPAALNSLGVEVDIRDAVQSIWDIFEEIAPAMKEAQRRLNGRDVNLIKPQSITFADGKTMRGGYYPAKGTDYTADPKTAKDTGNFIQKTFSFTLDRTGAVHGDLPLDLSMLTSWVGQMGKLLFVANYANNIEKLANDKNIKEAWGEDRVRDVKEWLAFTMIPERISPIIAKLSAVGSVLVLGGNVLKFAIQALGFTAALPFTGSQIIPSMVKNLTLVGWRQSYINATNKSVYMKNRYENPMNHLYNAKSVNNFFTDAASKGFDKAASLFMTFVTAGDNLASTTVWDAVYNKSLKEGKTESEAIMLADSAVRRTQGDTSHGSRPKALQGWLKLFSPFCSYFLAVHNIVTAHLQINTNRAKMQAVVMLAIYGVITPYLENMLSATMDFNSMSDEEKKKKRIKSFADFYRERKLENIVSSTVSTLVPIGGAGSYISKPVLRLFDVKGYSGSTIVPHEPIKRLSNILYAAVDEARGGNSDTKEALAKAVGFDKIMKDGRLIMYLYNELFK